MTRRVPSESTLCPDGLQPGLSRRTLSQLEHGTRGSMVRTGGRAGREHMPTAVVTGSMGSRAGTVGGRCVARLG